MPSNSSEPSSASAPPLARPRTPSNTATWPSSTIGPVRSDSTRRGSAIAISASSSVMRPSSSGFATRAGDARVDVGVAVERDRARERGEDAEIDEALHRQVERRILGRQSNGAAERQRVLGDEPRHVGHRDVALRELDARRPLLLDRNAGERELRRVEHDARRRWRRASSSGSFAAPFAEKLPTMPPVATLPLMRSMVSCSPLSAALTLRSCTADGRADPTERAVLDRERADGAEPAAVAAQIELQRAAAVERSPARRRPCRGESRPGSRRQIARGSCRRGACSTRPTRSSGRSRRARTDPSASHRRRAAPR